MGDAFSVPFILSCRDQFVFCFNKCLCFSQMKTTTTTKKHNNTKNLRPRQTIFFTDTQDRALCVNWSRKLWGRNFQSYLCHLGLMKSNICKKEPITRSEQLPRARVTAFSRTSLFQNEFEYLLNSTNQSAKPTNLRMIFLPFNNLKFTFLMSYFSSALIDMVEILLSPEKVP